MKIKTYNPKKGEIERKWHVIDLKNKVLGRAATQIANVLRGKNKPQFAHHVDVGDFVVVINASEIKLTGKKKEDKMYYKHSGYIGGLKEISAGELLVKNPDRIIREAVRGMLPRGVLGRAMLGKLKVYAGSDHPHQAQKPEALSI